MTAEAALVLPLLVAVTATLCWLLTVGLAQVRTVDAAREAARAAARGDGDAEASALARRIAPSGATVTLVRDGDTVLAEVSAQVDGPGGVLGGVLGALPGARTDFVAVAALEPGDLP